MHDGFVYTPTVGPSERFKWAEINAASIHLLPLASKALFIWKVQTFLGKYVDIQLGYFSQKDMQLFAQMLIQQTTAAHISNRVQAIAEGRFPWWLF